MDKNKNTFLSKNKNIVLTLILDIAFAIGAYFAAFHIVFFSWDVPIGLQGYEILVGAIFVIVVVCMLAFFDCYNTIWKYAGRIEFFKFMLSYLASFIMLIILEVVLESAFDIKIYATLIIMFLVFSAILSGLVRFFTAIINYVKHIRNWVDAKSKTKMKRTIIIGGGYTGSLAINRFINNPNEGYFPVAVLDDDKAKHLRKIYGIKVEGGVDDIDEIVYRYKAEAIVIAIMTLTKGQLKNIYTKCAKHNLPIKIIPGIQSADNMQTQVLELRDIKIEELLGREEFNVRQELMNISVKDKIVLVTGGAGSIGSELCRQSLLFGCKHLIIFDMHENGMFELNEEFSARFDTSKYTLVMGTVRERKKIKEVFEKYSPEIVFHAAAYKHVPMMEISATEAIKNNVFGTLNVIEECIEREVEKFVFISTDKAVNPANIMGASKRIAEMLIQTKGRDCKTQMAAVRFGNVLGSNGSVIPTFLRQIKAGGPITLTDRNIKRYFMTIPEAVKLVLQTGALARMGEVFVLDMGEPVYIYDLACDLIRINGLVPNEDIEIKITGLRPGEKLFEELRYDKESVNETIHEGIFVTKLENLDYAEFQNNLEKLYKYAHAEDEKLTAQTIFNIVPSVFRHMEASKQIESKEFTSQGAREHADNALNTQDAVN